MKKIITGIITLFIIFLLVGCATKQAEETEILQEIIEDDEDNMEEDAEKEEETLTEETKEENYLEEAIEETPTEVETVKEETSLPVTVDEKEYGIKETGVTVRCKTGYQECAWCAENKIPEGIDMSTKFYTKKCCRECTTL